MKIFICTCFILFIAVTAILGGTLRDNQLSKILRERLDRGSSQDLDSFGSEDDINELKRRVFTLENLDEITDRLLNDERAPEGLDDVSEYSTFEHQNNRVLQRRLPEDDENSASYKLPFNNRHKSASIHGDGPCGWDNKCLATTTRKPSVYSILRHLNKGFLQRHLPRDDVNLTFNKLPVEAQLRVPMGGGVCPKCVLTERPITSALSMNDYSTFEHLNKGFLQRSLNEGDLKSASYKQSFKRGPLNGNRCNDKDSKCLKSVFSIFEHLNKGVPQRHLPRDYVNSESNKLPFKEQRSIHIGGGACGGVCQTKKL